MVHKHQNHTCLSAQRLERQIVQDDALLRAPLLRRPFSPCVCGGSLGDMDRPLSGWGYYQTLG